MDYRHADNPEPFTEARSKSQLRRLQDEAVKDAPLDQEIAKAEYDHAQAWWIAHERRHGCWGTQCPIRLAITHAQIEINKLINPGE